MILKKKLGNNPHIQSYWTKCDLCRLNYDIIGKMHSFGADSKYILNKVHIKPNQVLLNETANSSSGESSTSVAKTFFSKLPPNLIKKLYQMYIIDFEMFGYQKDF